MQASIYLPSSLPFLSIKTSNTSLSCVGVIKTSSLSLKAKAKAKAKASSSDAPEVDYSSMASSVFPAEACETLGGVACDVEMFPETKLKETTSNNNKQQQQQQQPVDREYLQYDDNPKTVFIAEACDDLGGEFCEPAFHSGDD